MCNCQREPVQLEFDFMKEEHEQLVFDFMREPTSVEDTKSD